MATTSDEGNDDPILSSDSGDEEVTKDNGSTAKGQSTNDPKSRGETNASAVSNKADKIPGSDAARRKSSVAEDGMTFFSTLLVKYPFQSLIFVCIIAAILASGFSEMNVEEDINELWIEEGSVVSAEVDYTKANTYRIEDSESQLMMTVRHPNRGDSVLTEYALDRHLQAAKAMMDITVTRGSRTYGIADVCSSLRKYLFQCTRVTILDCFKEGAFDFPAYNAMYTISAVLEVVGGTLRDTIQPQLVEGTEDNAIGLVKEDLTGTVEENMIESVETAITDGVNLDLTTTVQDLFKLQVEDGLVAGFEQTVYNGTVAVVEGNTGGPDAALPACGLSAPVEWSVYVDCYMYLAYKDTPGTVANLAGSYISGMSSWTNFTNEAILAGAGVDRTAASYRDTAMDQAIQGASGGAFSLATFGGSNTTAFRDYCVDTALATINPAYSTASLGGSDSTTYQNTLISIALSPTSINTTLTSGKLDGFVREVEDQTVAAVEGGTFGPTAVATAQALYPSPTFTYRDALLNFGLKYNPLIGRDVAELGGAGSENYIVTMVDYGLTSTYGTTSTGLYTLQTQAVAGTPESSVETWGRIVIDLGLLTYNLSTSALGGENSTEYLEWMVNAALSQATMGTASIASLGGRTNETYYDMLISIALSPDNLNDTLTSGKLDSFIAKVEDEIVAGVEAMGSAAIGGAQATYPSMSYRDALLNFGLANNPAFGTDVVGLGGRTSVNYQVTMTNFGLTAQYGVTSLDLFGLQASTNADDESKWRLILTDLALLELNTSTAELGGSNTTEYEQYFIELFMDANNYTIPTDAFDTYTYSEGIIGAYLKFRQDTEVVPQVEDVFVELVEEALIEGAEEGMVPQAEAGIIDNIEGRGMPYVRMSLASNGYTVLTALPYSTAYNESLVSFGLGVAVGYTTAELGGVGSDEYNQACIDVALDVLFPGNSTESLGGKNSSEYRLTMIEVALDLAYNMSLEDDLGGRGSDEYREQLIEIGLDVNYNTSMAELGGRYSHAYNEFFGVLYAQSDTCGCCCPDDYLTNPRAFLKRFAGDGCPDPDTGDPLCANYAGTNVYMGANSSATAEEGCKAPLKEYFMYEMRPAETSILPGVEGSLNTSFVSGVESGLLDLVEPGIIDVTKTTMHTDTPGAIRLAVKEDLTGTVEENMIESVEGAITDGVNLDLTTTVQDIFKLQVEDGLVAGFEQTVYNGTVAVVEGNTGGPDAALPACGLSAPVEWSVYVDCYMYLAYKDTPGTVANLAGSYISGMSSWTNFTNEAIFYGTSQTVDRTAASYRDTAMDQAIQGASGGAFSLATFGGSNTTAFRDYCVDTALATINPAYSTASLGGSDSTTYQNTLISIALSPTSINTTLTSGKLDGFVREVEDQTVAAVEGGTFGPTAVATAQALYPSPTFTYRDALLNFGLKYNPLIGRDVAELGGAGSENYIVTMVDYGLTSTYGTTSTGLYTLQTQAVAGTPESSVETWGRIVIDLGLLTYNLSTSALGGENSTEYLEWMVNAALSQATMGTASIASLGGRTNETYYDTLISIALSPDNLNDTLTSGKLDSFIAKVEEGFVEGVEALGSAAVAGAQATYPSMSYFDALLNFGLANNPAVGTDVVGLGGRTSVNYQVTMTNLGLLTEYSISYTDLYTVQTQAVAGVAADVEKWDFILVDLGLLELNTSISDLNGFASEDFNRTMEDIALRTLMNVTLDELGGDNTTLYNETLIDLALRSQYDTSISQLGGQNSTAYKEQMIDIGLSQLEPVTSIAELGGYDSAGYRARMIDVGVSTTTAYATLAELQQNDADYEVFLLELYWIAVSAPEEDGGCGTPEETFTDKETFYEKFIDHNCPTLDTDAGTCAPNSACNCEDNLDGITPYSGRPSFYNNDNLEDAVNGTCYMWDNGLALPQVPMNLVLGQPDGSPSPEAWEFVLFTESPDSFAFEMTKRPFDPHTITVEEAKSILDEWQDKAVSNIPVKIATDTSTYSGADGNGYMVNFFGTNSLNIIVDNASDGARILLVAGLLCIYAYAFFTTGLSLLALGGVSLVLLGTLAGLGLSLWCGIALNATSINVLPFLMLGLGVDDMFLIIRTLIRISTDSSFTIVGGEDMEQKVWSEQMVGHVMVETGPTIALTTITNFCAFMIGTLTPLPVVQDFAITAALTVLVMFFLTCIGFPALCVLSIRYFPDVDLTILVRTFTRSVFFCCSKQRWFFMSCRKNEQTTQDDEESGPGVVETHVVPFLLNTYVRVSILFVFLGMLIFSSLGIGKIELGLSLKQLAEEGTQEYDFIEIRDTYFGFYPSSMAARENDYSTPEMQMAYIEAFNRSLDIRYNARQGANWIEEFLGWASDDCETGALIPECGPARGCNTNADGYFDAGQTAFENCVNDWYGLVTVTSQPRFYPLSNNGEGGDSIAFPITYVKVSMYSQYLWKTTDFVNLIDEMRGVLSSVKAERGIDLYPSGTVFEYWEQYRNLWTFLIQNLLIALTCTFFIGTIAILIACYHTRVSPMETVDHFILIGKACQGSFVMTLAIASTMTWVLGSMGWLSISMSAIPALTVIACMGICIDLTALVTLFFCSGVGTHDERISSALKCVFIPTLDSMMSTIVGCLALAFSVIELFVLYFFVMYVVVAVSGALNGLVLLPTLLYFIGPYASDVPTSGSSSTTKSIPASYVSPPPSPKKFEMIKSADKQLEGSSIATHEL